MNGLVRFIYGFVRAMNGLVVEFFDLGLLSKVLSLLKVVQMIKGKVKAWIRIRLRMVEGCKWMALMRVVELVTKIG